MKKAFITIIAIISVLTSCKNEPLIMEDFKYNVVYFPYQLPLRTLSLGEDRIDNSLDKEFQFDIGVCIGGIVANKKDWTVNYIVDNSLTDHVYIRLTNTKILPLPESFYTLNPLNMVVIPKGSIEGRIRVQLSEAFFNDPKALTGEYVIPLRLTSTSADTILSGKAIDAVPNPDRVINDDWEAGKLPKDWVMFGIKFINGYEGTYLQRGRRIRYADGTTVDTIVYRTAHVEQDRIVSMKTSSKNKTVTSFIGPERGLTFAMELEFANMWGTPGGQITISPVAGSAFAVTGTGQFFDKATSVESIIGLPMQSMHLNYSYDDGVNSYQISDTIVFRDRGLKFEQNSIVKIIP